MITKIQLMKPSTFSSFETNNNHNILAVHSNTLFRESNDDDYDSTANCLSLPS